MPCDTECRGGCNKAFDSRACLECQNDKGGFDFLFCFQHRHMRRWNFHRGRHCHWKILSKSNFSYQRIGTTVKKISFQNRTELNRSCCHFLISNLSTSCSSRTQSSIALKHVMPFIPTLVVCPNGKLTL